MRHEASDAGSVGEMEAIALALRDWRRAHPRATLTEIEQAVDRQWRTVRAELVASLALDVVDDPGACPQCGVPLIRRGQQERTLLTDGDAPIVWRRTYLSCPVCGHGLFPPG